MRWKSDLELRIEMCQSHCLILLMESAEDISIEYFGERGEEITFLRGD